MGNIGLFHRFVHERRQGKCRLIEEGEARFSIGKVSSGNKYSGQEAIGFLRLLCLIVPLTGLNNMPQLRLAITGA